METAEELDSRRRPFLRIRRRSGWQALDIRDLWRSREVLFALARKDITLRYRQTALGVAWVILQPLLAAGIFSFVFGRVAKLDSDGTPYFLFSYAGLVAWNAFSATLGKSSGSLVQNAGLISKVFFPRLALPLSTVCSTLVDATVAFLMLAIFLATERLWPGSRILFFPVALGLILLLSVGFGLIGAALTVQYRDVQYILPVLLQFALYASPVAYAVSAVPESARTLYCLNPLASLIEAFRWSVLGRGEVHWPFLIYSAVFSVAVFILGAFIFRRMERKFADVI